MLATKIDSALEHYVIKSITFTTFINNMLLWFNEINKFIKFNMIRLIVVNYINYIYGITQISINNNE